METDHNISFSLTQLFDLSNSTLKTTSPVAVEEPFQWTNAEIARLIQVIVRPILVAIGMIGNCLSFYIMRRTSLKDISSCFYMALLALADIGE